jgi:dethiobiotin synthetase
VIGRPACLALIAGTATDVGKTWVAAALAGELRAQGVMVRARKPVQSFVPGDRTDAELLAAATGDDQEAVCPPSGSYPVPMAPPMAAAALGRPVLGIGELYASLEWPDGVEVGLVESVGGVRSPLAPDGDTVTLAALLRPDRVIVVADAGLGTINAVRLAVGALAPWPCIVFLNRFAAGDDLHGRNRDWLAERDGYRVHTSMGDLVDDLRGRS